MSCAAAAAAVVESNAAAAAALAAAVRTPEWQFLVWSPLFSGGLGGEEQCL